VLPESAVTLGRNLDRADPRSAVNLARALVDVLDERQDGVGEPDAIDELIRRREARLLERKVRNGG
jgi:hypothetical protein